MGCVSWVLALLLAVAGSTPSNAQMLTEEQFLKDVLTNHPGIAAAEAGVAAAAGTRRQEGIVDNPLFSWEREDPDIAARQDTWLLSWRLPFDGRRHRVAAADAAAAASSSDLDTVRLEIRLEMRSLFASWYIATERESVLQENLVRTRRLAEWLRARAEEGEAAGVEAKRLDLEVEVLERGSAAISADAQAYRAAAGAWSGLVTVEIQPGRPLLAPPPATVEVGDRPDVRASAHRAEEAEARRRLQRRVFEPPEISVGWMEIRDSLQSFDGPVLGVAWPLPVFDRNQGNRENAAARAEMARSELEVSKRRAQQDAEAALARYSDLYRAVAPTGARDSDADVARAVFAAFDAGEASLTDVLDALRATVDVQMARLETLALALAAERELEAAVGRPNLPGGSS